MAANSALNNMRIDRTLLDDAVAGRQPPTLRFYEWRSAAFSFGYSQEIPDLVDMRACEQAGLELVQRPTGGGLVIHGWDLTYSVIAPTDGKVLPRGVLASYEAIHQHVLAALKALGIQATLSPDCHRQGIPRLCLENVAPFDILLDGHKVAGGAQRRKKGYLLHQGYLALQSPPVAILRLAGNSSITGHLSSAGKHLAREALIQAIEHQFCTESPT